MAEVSVEWLRDADDAMHADVYAVLSEVVGDGGAVGWLRVPEPDEARAWLDQELAVVRADLADFAVARLEGEPAGLGILSRYRAPVLAHNAEVRKLMTRPRARGLGVARALLEALEQRAREHALENLKLDVRGNNHGAMALYESLGWQRCGVVPDFIALGNERWDQVNYVRMLDRPAGAVLHGQRVAGPGASTRRGAAPDQS